MKKENYGTLDIKDHLSGDIIHCSQLNMASQTKMEKLIGRQGSEEKLGPKAIRSTKMEPGPSEAQRRKDGMGSLERQLPW